MFSLKPGPLTNYRSELIRELCMVDDSKYIFNAEVTHAYEDSSYNNLNKEDLQLALTEDLKEFNSYLKVVKVIELNSPSGGGWPYIVVQNTKPMTIKEFLTTLNKIYFDECIEYLISDCLDVMSVVKEV